MFVHITFAAFAVTLFGGIQRLIRNFFIQALRTKIFLFKHCILQNVKENQRVKMRVKMLELKINKDIVTCGPIVQLRFTDIISLKRDNFKKAREREAERERGEGT